MFRVGQKIKFSTEKHRYTIQACNERFLICTKPFNAKRTVLYTIVDLKESIRGSDNLVFCHGYETRDHCERALELLINGDIGISYRNRIMLDLHKLD
jgi:hypothetical protein